MELKHILANDGDGSADEEWEKLISEFDNDCDGMINFEEFKKMMVQMHKRATGQDMVNQVN
jgi:Ca2+-binding EF-hand superfamily protein